MLPRTDETTTVVISDREKMARLALQDPSGLNENLDACFDASCQSAFPLDIVRSSFAQLKERGIKIRLITDITKKNLEYFKDLIKVLELRHLDGAIGNFEVRDGKEVRIHHNLKEDGSLVQEIIVSNVRSFVEQQQFLFDVLWNTAIPAERRREEIEEGILPETTRIVQGTENIVRSQVEGLSDARQSLDACCDHTFPVSLVLSNEVWDMCSAFYDRGMKTRIITEITQENVEYCKKMATRMHVRHMDTISGNFSIIDGKEYRGSAAMREGKPPTEGIFSTANAFVEQQQYFFETLWNKSIPAKQRIREIEEGAKREFIESIRDPAEMQRVSHELIKSAKEEILIIFSTATAFHHQEKGGILSKLKDELASSSLLRGVKIRILVPMDSTIRNETAKELADIGIDVRNYNKDAPLPAELTILLVDGIYVLNIELKGDPDERIEEATGLATYSNSESAFLSAASIFETLWMQKSQRNIAHYSGKEKQEMGA